MAILIATVVLSLVGIATNLSSEPVGDETPAPAEPPPEHRAHGFFGISPQGVLHKKDYKRMGAGKVAIMRYGLTWDTVQSVPGLCEPEPQVDTCSWSEFDAIVRQSAMRGIRVLPTVGGRPEFTRDPGTGKYIRQHPPISGEPLVAWRAFVRSAAERYGRDGVFWDEFVEQTGLEPLPIEEWQVWNEPNAASYWPPKPKASEYATLVEETSNAIREGDPEAEIVLGGMFGTATVSSRKYLASLYSVEGIEDHFDSIAIHPYAPTVKGIAAQAEWVRDVAEKAGDGEVGLWATELGAGSGSGNHPLELGNAGQDKLLRGAFELFETQRDAWNVEGVTWFTWEDQDDGLVCRFCAHAGLFDADGRAKPSWETYKEFSKELQR